MTGPLRNDAATSAFLRWPVAVVDLACLGALISASVLVLTTAGVTQSRRIGTAREREPPTLTRLCDRRGCGLGTGVHVW